MEKKMINCYDLIFDPMLAGHVGLDQKKVERLRADFREELVTPPVVVFLKGKYYLLDGAHVVEAMKRLLKTIGYHVIGDVDDQQSTSGYGVFLGKSLIS